MYLSGKGTAAKPITIRAKDPANPPKWDLTNTLVENAPGSYDGGDKGRGCWQIDGAEYVTISGIVFTGCRNAGHNSAAIRYYNGAKGLVLRDSLSN